MADIVHFEHWAAKARTETAPVPDVTAAVARRLAALETRGAPAGQWFPLVWAWSMAGVAACTAALCGIAGYAAWSDLAANVFASFPELAAWSAL